MQQWKCVRSTHCVPSTSPVVCVNYILMKLKKIWKTRCVNVSFRRQTRFPVDLPPCMCTRWKLLVQMVVGLGVQPVSHPFPALPRCMWQCDAHIWDDGLGWDWTCFLGSSLRWGEDCRRQQVSRLVFTAQFVTKDTPTSQIILFAQPQGSSFTGNHHSMVAWSQTRSMCHLSTG